MTYLLLYKDLKAIYNAYIEKNTRSKKGKVKMWKEQYCTAMPIVFMLVWKCFIIQNMLVSH